MTSSPPIFPSAHAAPLLTKPLSSCIELIKGSTAFLLPIFPKAQAAPPLTLQSGSFNNSINGSTAVSPILLRAPDVSRLTHLLLSLKLLISGFIALSSLISPSALAEYLLIFLFSSSKASIRDSTAGSPISSSNSEA